MPVDVAMVEHTRPRGAAPGRDTAEIAVQLHPDDLALLRQHQSDVLTGAPEPGPLRFAQLAGDQPRRLCHPDPLRPH